VSEDLMKKIHEAQMENIFDVELSPPNFINFPPFFTMDRKNTVGFEDTFDPKKQREQSKNQTLSTEQSAKEQNTTFDPALSNILA